MSAHHQGTESLLEFAASLEQRAENLRSFFDYNAGAADLLRCKAIIERLAVLEPEIEAVVGEN